ncbi:MAG TPA: UPF0175 family protein [Planctomycetota bacterium]|nr:UPF0175 family protein [Planctomycetota bacterium]
MTVQLDLQDGLRAALGAAGYTAERLSEEARRQLAAALFARKVLSLGKAAELAGMSLWDFIPFLGQHEIPYLDYDEDEWKKELEAARPLFQRLESQPPSPRSWEASGSTTRVANA